MTTHNPLRCSNSAMVQRGTNEVVLFNSGSYPTTSSFLNQTWTWSGTDWNNINSINASSLDPNGPLPGRSDEVIAYDGYNIMLYGGRSSTASLGILQDTWLWNGTTWSLVASTISPFGRYKAQACNLTTSSAQVVMFGGFGGYTRYLDETWIWNGNTQNWTLASPTTSPLARVDHCMAPGASYVLLFGGSSSNSQLNDTWKFDGINWIQLTTTVSPSVRSGCSMAYDTTHSKWVLFGGVEEYNFLPETWTFDGTNWIKQNPTTSPSGKKNAQMCWDSQSGTILLYGGINETDGSTSNETWSWSGNNWFKK